MTIQYCIDRKEECDLDRQPQPNETVDKEMIMDPISDSIQIANQLEDGKTDTLDLHL